MFMSRPLTTAEAIREARRCLDCARPSCVGGCPIEINIPEFIRALAGGNIGIAYETITESSNLPAICGRVCPHERQCEARCLLAKKQCGIEIGSLESFVADFAQSNGIKPLRPSAKDKGRVAVIGSGPAGLTVAGDLAKLDFDVTIFEAQSEPGGVLLFGIPEYRLQKDVVRREIAQLRGLGVEIKTGQLAGEDFTVDDLFRAGFDAIFIGIGSSLPRTLDIPGKELSGIQAASYFLRTAMLADEGKLDESETLLHSGENVIVVGDDNMAMEAARTAARRGAAAVTVVSGKAEAEMQATAEEYQKTLAAGVQFSFLKQPMAYFNKKQMRALRNIRRAAEPGDESEVAGLLVQNMSKSAEDEYVPEGGQQMLAAGSVILSVGHKPVARIISTTYGLQLDSRGYVITRERPYGMTTRAGVFSSGDNVHGPATVVLAMKESKRVAAGIAQYIDAKKLLEDCGLH